MNEKRKKLIYQMFHKLTMGALGHHTGPIKTSNPDIICIWFTPKINVGITFVHNICK